MLQQSASISADFPKNLGVKVLDLSLLHLKYSLSLPFEHRRTIIADSCQCWLHFALLRSYFDVNLSPAHEKLHIVLIVAMINPITDL